MGFRVLGRRAQGLLLKGAKGQSKQVILSRLRFDIAVQFNPNYRRLPEPLEHKVRLRVCAPICWERRVHGECERKLFLP